MFRNPLQYLPKASKFMSHERLWSFCLTAINCARSCTLNIATRIEVSKRFHSQRITNKMQRFTIYLFLYHALHVSDGFSVHQSSRAQNCTYSVRYWSDQYYYHWTAVAQWLRCCATNRKVGCSIPVGVIGIFHWYKILLIALWPWGRLRL